MVGPPVKRAVPTGRLAGAEEEPEGLLDTPRAVAVVDVGGKNLPFPDARRGSRVAHRDTS
jgi:hypothetical protein